MELLLQLLTLGHLVKTSLIHLRQKLEREKALVHRTLLLPHTMNILNLFLRLLKVMVAIFDTDNSIALIIITRMTVWKRLGKNEL